MHFSDAETAGIPDRANNKEVENEKNDFAQYGIAFHDYGAYRFL